VVLRENSPEMLADLHEHMRRAVPEPPARPKLIVPLEALPMTWQSRQACAPAGCGRACRQRNPRRLANFRCVSHRHHR
jgi:hypothetical protein